MGIILMYFFNSRETKFQLIWKMNYPYLSDYKQNFFSEKYFEQGCISFLGLIIKQNFQFFKNLRLDTLHLQGS